MKKSDKHEKKVGVEVEFAGIEFAQASAIVAQTLTTEPRITSPHEHEFDSARGAYRLEVDFGLLKRLSREEHAAADDDPLRRAAVGALDLVASMATPLELVSPPLTVDDLPAFSSLLDEFAAAGAYGTRESIIYAFGVHFNPTAQLDARSITAHLRAFLGLYEWLKERDATDITRVLTAFAKPFPEEYERKVLAPDYQPPMSTLIDDYLEFNPTRNRALDLLPLFAEIDSKRVKAVIDDERVNNRPTYHYRLPNSRVGDPDWSVMRPWDDWLEVERMAEDPKRLDALCRQRLAHLDKIFLTRRDDDWMDACQALIDDR